jgi:glycosyltransferase involved in cell wall biosynthesis
VATRIVILSNYPPDHVSFTTGVETATASLLEGLRTYQGLFEFHIISVTNQIRSDLVENRSGFWFHFLSSPRNPFARPRLPLRLIKTYKELNRIQPALVHCHDNMALALAAIFSGYPRIFTVHGIKRHEAGKRSGWDFYSAHVDALLERYVHRRFDALVFVSQYAEDTVGHARMAYSIPNAVSSLFFRMHAQPNPMNPYVVFVGTMEPLKRPGDLLLAHEELRRQFPNLEAIFCGEFQVAGYAHKIQQMVCRRKIEGLRFEGRVGQARLAELFRKAIALVVPSSQENAPMVIAEAMATGLPVVATRVGGIPDMVRDGENGMLYSVGNIPELTACIRRLLVDPGVQSRLGQRGREIAAKQYCPKRVARETVFAYRQILERSHGPNCEKTNA